jgi:hypothetical protein
VKDAGNPIVMDLKTRYKVKGIGSEQTIKSVVKIHTDGSGERITQVEDRWNGNIPEGAFAKVRLFQLLSPFWWIHSFQILGFWCWSFVWWTRPWEVGGRGFLKLPPEVDVRCGGRKGRRVRGDAGRKRKSRLICVKMQAFRNLNSVVVPAFVGVPKSSAEEGKSK